MTIRNILLAAAIASTSAAQMSAPLIGYVRDRAGTLRAVSGVAGAFVLGEPLERGVAAVHFDGESGCARTADRTVSIRADRTVEPQPDGEGCSATAPAVEIDGDEAVIVATGVRLRVDAGVAVVERAGREWFVLRAPARLLMVRTERGKEAVFALPEAPE